MNPWIIKYVFEQRVVKRNLTLGDSESLDLDVIHEIPRAAYNLKPDQFRIYYKDMDGDIIRINNKLDLEAAEYEFQKERKLKFILEREYWEDEKVDDDDQPPVSDIATD